jgi:hypothetical protein
MFNHDAVSALGKWGQLAREFSSLRSPAADLRLSDERATALLKSWGQLGRQSHQAPSFGAGWEPASRIVKVAFPFFKVLADELTELLDQSDKRLKPFADPLWTDFGTHRWLKADREEAYSDWLAWIVENLK